MEFNLHSTQMQKEEAEQERRALSEERERLAREVAPLTAAAEAFRQTEGKKPDKRQIPALIAENARLAKEPEYSHRDQSDLFSQLQEAITAAERRKREKHAPKRSSSTWTK